MTTTKNHYLKASFLVCTAVLLIAATTKALIINRLGIQLTKLQIRLQKPLAELDETALSPYKVVNKQTIQNRDILESLGTEEYLQWTLENPDVESGSSTRFCSLFITYYTGNPDMVPHVPNECYVGGGNELQSSQTLSVELPLEKKVGFQYVRFLQTNQDTMRESSSFSVQYLFHANGKYCQSRTETRTTLFDWFSRYSYFCKVEWKFFGQGPWGLTFPDEEQTLDASAKLLSILLPELEKNHWPDWKKINANTDKPDEGDFID